MGEYDCNIHMEEPNEVVTESYRFPLGQKPQMTKKQQMAANLEL